MLEASHSFSSSSEDSERDLIVALSSAQGAAAIAVVRLTGTGALNLLAKCFVGVKEAQPAKMQLCTLIDPQTQREIDQPMVAYFVGPHSYTGQDTVEVFLHGGPFIVQQTLKLFYALGARPAQPGEFTRRAFLSGKIDLSAAEGINELCSAHSESQWQAARYLASGKLRSHIDDLRRTLAEALAWLAARIDFPDEKETSDIVWHDVDTRVELARVSIERLHNSYDNGRVARNGLQVVIFGRPNAGKSTLLNELLGKDRAIVSLSPGTTRDYLEENCLINGRLINLIDTAGLRESSCEVEAEGIQRSVAMAHDADVILFLLPADATEEELHELAKWQDELKTKVFVQVLTKADLAIRPNCDLSKFMPVSCHQGSGLKELKEAIAKVADSYTGRIAEQPFISSARHKAALETALGAIERFGAGRASGAYEDMLFFELREAQAALEGIIGHISTDDILDVVFSSFCVGK